MSLDSDFFLFDELALRSRSCRRSWRASSARCTWPPSNTWRCRNLQRKKSPLETDKIAQSLHSYWLRHLRAKDHLLDGKDDEQGHVREPTPPFFHCALANSHISPPKLPKTPLLVLASLVCTSALPFAREVKLRMTRLPSPPPPTAAVVGQKTASQAVGAAVHWLGGR